MRKILVPFLVMLALCSYAQFSSPIKRVSITGDLLTDLQLMNLNKSVKEIIQYNYNTIVSETGFEKGTIFSGNVGDYYIFNDEGYMLEWGDYKDSVNLSKRIQYNHFKYHRNNEEAYFEIEKYEKDALYTKSRYLFNKHGKVGKIIVSKPDGTVSTTYTLKYNKKTGRITGYSYKQNYNYNYSIKYTELEQGYLQLDKYYGQSLEDSYLYNPEGKITQHIDHKTKYSAKKEYIYTISDKGDVIKEKKSDYSLMGGYVKNYKYDYIYNEDNNWTTKVSFTVDPKLFRNIDGKLTYVGDKAYLISERKITYH